MNKIIPKKNFAALGLLTFLLVVSALTPVVVNGWENPLATDPSSDPGLDVPYEDILSVDAQYANGFVDFRFKMNGSLIWLMWYDVLVDVDKNVSTGGITIDSDIGWDFWLECHIFSVTPDIGVEVRVSVYGGSNEWVSYNMTANNGTALSWSDPSIVPYLHLAIFTNGTQGDLAFGVNWAWVTAQVALEGVTGDGRSMFLEFQSGFDTDWCPDRTIGDSDYIEWEFDTGGEDGFPWWVVGIIIGSAAGLAVVILVMLMRRKT